MTKILKVTFKQALKWYGSNNDTLKKLATSLYSKEELENIKYTNIKTFEDALKVFLKYNDVDRLTVLNTINRLEEISKTTAAIFKLKIINKALQLEYLNTNTSSPSIIYFPKFSFNLVLINNSYLQETKLGRFIKGQKIYEASYDITPSVTLSSHDVTYISLAYNILGYNTKEMTQHLITYFWPIILTAFFGDIEDFKILQND